MTDIIRHECGIAVIRLLKPLDYYYNKYGTWQYGLDKLYLLMEKQHNRGQEGAGLGAVKLQALPGNEFIFRERALGSGAIAEIFSKVHASFQDFTPEQLHDIEFVKKSVPYAAELFIGHLRYSTTGKNGLTYVHPLLRRNNWASRSLALAGNFNMTNVDEMFQHLIEEGQHPRDYADTFVMLESIGHYLDREVQYQYDHLEKSNLTGQQISQQIEEKLDIPFLLKRASKIWDGGYALCGLVGCGDAFALRDPWGIRSAFYYHDDEVVVVASERPVIQTAFNLKKEEIHELQPGEAIVVKRKRIYHPASDPGEKRKNKRPVLLNGSTFHEDLTMTSTANGKSWGNCWYPKSFRPSMMISTTRYSLLFPTRLRSLIMGCCRALRIISTEKKHHDTGKEGHVEQRRN